MRSFGTALARFKSPPTWIPQMLSTLTSGIVSARAAPTVNDFEATLEVNRGLLLTLRMVAVKRHLK